MADRPIKRGDYVCIKPEWRDPGDDEYIWIAIEDEDGGRVRIAPIMELPIPPNQVVTTNMIEHANRRVSPVRPVGRRL